MAASYSPLTHCPGGRGPLGYVGAPLAGGLWHAQRPRDTDRRGREPLTVCCLATDHLSCGKGAPSLSRELGNWIGAPFNKNNIMEQRWGRREGRKLKALQTEGAGGGYGGRDSCRRGKPKRRDTAARPPHAIPVDKGVVRAVGNGRAEEGTCGKGLGAEERVRWAKGGLGVGDGLGDGGLLRRPSARRPVDPTGC